MLGMSQLTTLEWTERRETRERLHGQKQRGQAGLNGPRAQRLPGTDLDATQMNTFLIGRCQSPASTKI